MEGQDVVGSQNQADLLRHDLVDPRLAADRFDNDIEIILVVLDLGALVDIQDVFQDQGVQLEALPQPFQVAHVGNAADVDPGDPGFIWPQPGIRPRR